MSMFRMEQGFAVSFSYFNPGLNYFYQGLIGRIEPVLYFNVYLFLE